MNIKQAYYLTLREFGYNHSFVSQMGKPAVRQIELTNICPMQCIMCVRKKMTRPLGFMEEWLFKSVVEQIRGVNTHIILHHFGESLLHPHLYNLLFCLKKTKIKSILSANPTELSQERIEAVCRGGLNDLILSIDGATQETYRSIRGDHADLGLAENNISALIVFKNKFKFKYPRLIIQMIRMKKNEQEVPLFRKKWGISGIDEVYIKDFYTWSCSPQDIKELSPIKRPQSSFPCSCPWLDMVILWDGRVVPCCNDFDGLYVLGNAKEMFLKEIWNGHSMLMLREQHRNSKLSGNILCRDCVVKEGYAPTRLYPLTPKFWLLNSLSKRLKKNSMGHE